MKRKYNFNPQWEMDFFFKLNQFNQATCMICYTIINTSSKSNIERHYNRFHRDDYIHYNGIQKTDLLKELEENFIVFLENSVQDSNEIVDIKKAPIKASFVAAQILSQNMCNHLAMANFFRKHLLMC